MKALMVHREQAVATTEFHCRYGNHDNTRKLWKDGIENTGVLHLNNAAMWADFLLKGARTKEVVFCRVSLK